MYSEFNPYRLSGTAAGTTAIVGHGCNLHSIVIGTATTGTVAFYNNDTTDAAADFMFTLDNNIATVNLPLSLPVEAALNKGLTAVVSGTVDMLVLWN